MCTTGGIPDWRTWQMLINADDGGAPASGKADGARMGRWAAGASSSRFLIAAAWGFSRGHHFVKVFAASAAGDPCAREIVGELACTTAAVLHNAHTFFSILTLSSSMGDFAYADSFFDRMLKQRLAQLSTYPDLGLFETVYDKRPIAELMRWAYPPRWRTSSSAPTLCIRARKNNSFRHISAGGLRAVVRREARVAFWNEKGRRPYTVKECAFSKCGTGNSGQAPDFQFSL